MPQGVAGVVAGAGARWAKALLAVVFFVAAVRTVGAAADALGPTIEDWIAEVVDDPATTLGAGWLLTYLLANGSVVAGLAVTLVSSSAVVPAAGFLLLCGSRLGAASFIMLLGLLEYARTRPRPPLARALGLGFVTFLVGLSVYLPATAIGYAFFSPLHDRMTARLPARFDVGFISRSEELTTGLVDVVGPLPVAVIGVVLAVASLRLFDAFLDGVDEDKMRRRLRRWLRFRGVSFSAGLIVSALTTSIALSVGALVPLFARGMVKAREMIPYVLGAGLGTMADTVLVALILGSPSAVAVTIVLLATAAVLTLVYLAAGATYTNAVEGLYCALAASPQRAATFAAVLVAFPALLFLVV